MGIFEALDNKMLSKDQRQSVALNLALCHQSAGNKQLAREAAAATIAVDKHSQIALQAKIVIAEMIEDPTPRILELKKLMGVAQRKEAQVLLNQTRLSLASETSVDDQISKDFLRQIIDEHQTKGDFYNGARAIVNLHEMFEPHEFLSPADRARLISSYHFFIMSESFRSLTVAMPHYGIFLKEKMTI
jgi:dGTP triphosphohydrolase